MKLENQVTSVKLSNKLHKLGVINPSLFYREWTGAKENEIEVWSKLDYCEDNVNCYTVAELGEMLPWIIDKQELRTKKSKSGWWCFYEKQERDIESLNIEWAKTEADVRAKMLIYLIEKNLWNTKQNDSI